MADKIKLVIENQNLRKKLIENGRKIADSLSWRKTAEETLNVYKSIK